MRRGLRASCQKHVEPAAGLPEVRPRASREDLQRLRFAWRLIERRLFGVVRKLFERRLFDLRAMKIAVISDTHLGARQCEAPRGFWELLDSADRVIHLGDFIGAEFADMVAKRSPLTAVSGNCDPGAVRARFPTAATVVLDGVTAELSHIPPLLGGDAAQAARGLRERGVSLCLYGHTHHSEDFETDGVRFINPGTAGGSPLPGEGPTAGILEIKDGLVEWRVVELGRKE